ncbi:hypothetical protein GLOIN_2v1790625 [Rhizophagus clarus]|uniref:SAM domain-containing protein n=1 Tax=Rhizophagus clarus TaxID=94130 RepID=A0A8H3QZ81_9GLOM|nr:hypothetical protein GLOIN_2v1790625 [Rhizophagus clarus]
MSQKKSKKKSSREQDTDISMDVTTPKFDDMFEEKSSTVVSTDGELDPPKPKKSKKKSSKEGATTKEKSKKASSSKHAETMDVDKRTETVSPVKPTKVKKTIKGEATASNAKEKVKEVSSSSALNMETSDIEIVETVEEIEKLNRNDLINYLKNKKELDLDKQDINIIKSAKFTGQVFLNLTQHDLESIGLALGPAKAIAGLVKTLNGEEEQVIRKRKYEELPLDIIKIAVEEEISRQKSKAAKVDDQQIDLPTSLSPYKRVKASEEYTPKDDEDKEPEMVTDTLGV